jgi:8-oxo-dGTP diphosphatase
VTSKREYPDRPLVGVGGVVIDGGRTLLIKRGGPPLEGQWSIPGGMLELGETLREGAERELVEVFERIFPDESGRIRYHFVIHDFLCDVVGGEARAASDVTDVAWARKDELGEYGLTETATRVLLRAFAMAEKSVAGAEKTVAGE